MEESVFGARAQWPAGSTETADVVIGGGCRGFSSANIFGSITIDHFVPHWDRGSHCGRAVGHGRRGWSHCGEGNGDGGKQEVGAKV